MGVLMDVLVPLILVGLILVLCVMGGFLATELSVESGAGALIFAALLTTAAMTAFCAWLGGGYAEMTYRAEPRSGAIVMGVLGALCTLYGPVSALLSASSDAAAHRAWAPKAQAFAQQHFDKLDANRDGTITDPELERASNTLFRSGEAHEIVGYLRNQQQYAGHVIDSYTTTTYVWISDGKGGGYMSPVISTTYVYGITRHDLERYPARIKHKWRNW